VRVEQTTTAALLCYVQAMSNTLLDSSGMPYSIGHLCRLFTAEERATAAARRIPAHIQLDTHM
jgi:hypothetical protein